MTESVKLKKLLKSMSDEGKRRICWDIISEHEHDELEQEALDILKELDKPCGEG